MSKLLLVGLLVVFVGHFTAEVFVEDKRLQRLLNNLSFVGLSIWFLVAIIGALLFGA